ncbi:MAG TPA: glycosyltransferase family 4 protein [Thermoanaerobaculia bacterium]|nr:glycosyltransferase family 4 protein [Thermoanaerobaculia bacterium]
MRITYVLPYPELNGGNKVIFQHASMLQELGHELTILAEGSKPDWIRIDAAYVNIGIEAIAAVRIPSQDLVIATYWTTIERSRQLALGPLAHFCQGYEGGLVHLAPILPRIEEAYSIPLPTLTVSPHLADLVRDRFGREGFVVPPPLDPLFHPAFRLRPRREPWIAIPGIFGAEVKGVPTALEAVRRLRERGYACRVLRISVMELTEEERRLLEPDRFLTGVAPAEIARELRECDLLLFPSREEEGFGLPLLEAMVSRVPAVASRISSTMNIGDGSVKLVPPGDAQAFAEAAEELLSDAGAWRRARRRGWQASRRFRPEEVVPRLDQGVHWAHAKALEKESER